MPFSGGTGILADPYLIANVTDFKNIETAMTAYFKQVADITLGTFEPIGYNGNGYYTSDFRGYYDGNGFTLKDGVIVYPSNWSTDSWKVGIFASTIGGRLYNIKLDNIQVEGYGDVGTLVGTAVDTLFYGIINNASSSVIGQTDVGGIVGSYRGCAIDPLIRKCSNHANVTVVSFGGGIVGDIEVTSVEGIYQYKMSIVDSYNTGQIISRELSGGWYLGGIVGQVHHEGSLSYQSHFYIERCYNSGQLSGKYVIGGILGGVDSYGSQYGDNFINDCFSLCDAITRLSGTNTTFGRIIAAIPSYNPLTLSDNYALDTMTEPFSGAWSQKTTDGKDGADITLANAKKQTTYTNLGWNFSTTWSITEDSSFPFHIWDIPSTSFFKVYTGSEWKIVPLNNYNGLEWVSVSTKIFSGTEWL